MLALCSMLSGTYYAQNYSWSLSIRVPQSFPSEMHKIYFLQCLLPKDAPSMPAFSITLFEPYYDTTFASKILHDIKNSLYKTIL